MKNILLWDADGLAYKHRETDSIEEAISKVDEYIENILKFTNADGYCLFLSEGKYFRHDISKSTHDIQGSYKSKRVLGKQPWIKTIKAYLKAKYGAVSYRKLEADDLVVYLNNQELVLHDNKILKCSTTENPNGDCLSSNVNTIIVSSDKDVLYNVKGKHCNPFKKTGDSTWEPVWIDTPADKAPFGIWKQMVCGDTSDSIVGIKGKGPAWCNKNFIGKTLREVRLLVLDEYLNMYGVSKGVYEFQKNYRLLHMLESDEDYIREVGYIPELPNFTILNKLSINEINF